MLTISMCSHATEIYGKQSQKREMLSVKALSLLTGVWKTALKLRINAGNKDATNAQDKAIADA